MIFLFFLHVFWLPFFTHQFLFNWFAFIRPAVCIIHYFLFITMRFGQFAINRHCCFISLSFRFLHSTAYCVTRGLSFFLSLLTYGVSSIKHCSRAGLSSISFSLDTTAFYVSFVQFVVCVCQMNETLDGLNTSVSVVYERRKKCSCCFDMTRDYINLFKRCMVC